MMKHRQNGYTLVELMFAAAIGLTIIGTMTWQWANAHAETRGLNAANDVIGLVDRIRRHYAGRADLSGLSTTYVIQQELAPSRMVSQVNGTNVLNLPGFGGANTIGVVPVTSAAPWFGRPEHGLLSAENMAVWVQLRQARPSSSECVRFVQHLVEYGALVIRPGRVTYYSTQSDYLRWVCLGGVLYADVLFDV